MKVKIKEGKKLLFAGVTQYEGIDSSKRATNKNKFNYKVDVDLEELEKVKKAAIKYSSVCMKSIGDVIGAVGSAFDKEDRKDNVVDVEFQEEGDEGAKDSDSEEYKSFEETMHKFAKGMERGGAEFVKHMNILGDKIEEWGQKHGPDIDEWADKRAKDVDQFATKMQEKWEDIWEYDDDIDENKGNSLLESIYKEMYHEYIKDQLFEIDLKNYFEIQMTDLGIDGNQGSVAYASRINGFEHIPSQLQMMQYEAQKWALIKCTEEEYENDWLSELQKHEDLKGYTFGDYFIVRHGHEVSYNYIKILCPLSVKTDV